MNFCNTGNSPSVLIEFTALDGTHRAVVQDAEGDLIYAKVVEDTPLPPPIDDAVDVFIA